MSALHRITQQSDFFGVHFPIRERGNPMRSDDRTRHVLYTSNPRATKKNREGLQPISQLLHRTRHDAAKKAHG